MAGAAGGNNSSDFVRLLPRLDALSRRAFANARAGSQTVQVGISSAIQTHVLLFEVTSY